MVDLERHNKRHLSFIKTTLIEMYISLKDLLYTFRILCVLHNFKASSGVKELDISFINTNDFNENIARSQLLVCYCIYLFKI